MPKKPVLRIAVAVRDDAYWTGANLAETDLNLPITGQEPIEEIVGQAQDEVGRIVRAMLSSPSTTRQITEALAPAEDKVA
jgi:hypothetical protein